MILAQRANFALICEQRICGCLLWVKSVVLTMRRPLPVFPEKGQRSRLQTLPFAERRSYNRCTGVLRSRRWRRDALEPSCHGPGSKGAHTHELAVLGDGHHGAPASICARYKASIWVNRFCDESQESQDYPLLSCPERSRPPTSEGSSAAAVLERRLPHGLGNPRAAHLGQ
jgi:hypothetical protein